MSLASKLENYAPSKKCSTNSWLVTLSEEDRQAAQEALADENWSTLSLHKILRSEGYPLNADTLRKHRKGECACGTVR